MNYEGRIEVVFGPMFSGKSSELIRRVRRHQIAKTIEGWTLLEEWRGWRGGAAVRAA